MDGRILESNHPAKNGSDSMNRKVGPEISPFFLTENSETLLPSKDELFSPHSNSPKSPQPAVWGWVNSGVALWKRERRYVVPADYRLRR